MPYNPGPQHRDQAPVCYTIAMNRAASKRSRPAGQTSYALAVQGMAILAQLGVALGALSFELPRGSLLSLLILTGLNLLALLLLPTRRLPRWAQLLFLAAQTGSAAVAQSMVPTALFGYVYLAIVLQAIVLLPLWLWIPFAVVVYAVWSGMLAIATANLVAWLQGNLALAFPATCAIIAAIVYARQQRRSEQVQQMLAQVEQRYDSLASGMRELQQRVILEERRRLSQTIVDEVQAALSRTEQSVGAAVSQAQVELGRLQSTVAQTRAAAAQSVERLRSAVAALRGDQHEPPPAAPIAALSASDEAVLAGRSSLVLTWVLPGVFVVLAIGLTLVQGQWAVEVLLPLVVCASLLLLAYVGTQLTHNPVLLQAGLVGQAVAVLAMTVISHTLPLLLGLLLILWQLSLRLPLRQIVVYLAGLPMAAALLVARLSPVALSLDTLLLGAVATVAVGGPLLLARRQLERRKQAELQVGLLNAEIELQTAEMRALAVAAERSRVAREVHDDLGSRLMLINLQLQLAEELAADDAPAALEQLQGSREQLQGVWRGVLAAVDAELPLATNELPVALAQLVAKSPGASLSLDGELGELPEPVAVAAYRSVQEGLTNARKHAVATAIEVRVAAINGYVTIVVSNDGAHAEREEGRGDSFGLLGLRERAEALGGGIEAGPTAEGGWRLRVVLPTEEG